MARKTTQKADAKDVHLQGLCSEDIAYFFDSKDEHRNQFFALIYKDFVSRFSVSRLMFPDIAVLLRAVDNFTQYILSGKSVNEILTALSQNDTWATLTDGQKDCIITWTHKLVMLLRVTTDTANMTEQMEQAETDLEKEMERYIAKYTPQKELSAAELLLSLLDKYKDLQFYDIIGNKFAPTVRDGECLVIIPSDLLQIGKKTLFKKKDGTHCIASAEIKEDGTVILRSDGDNRVQDTLTPADVSVLGFVAMVVRKIK
jgi:hypothetical protein